MLKNWLIAGGVFIVGLAAAVFMGRAKQRSADVAKSNEAVNHELDRISKTATSAQNTVENLPPSGPGSATQQLHDDWSEQ